MDGVILQSNHIKHAAMLDLFAAWPQYIGLVDQYNRGGGGIPRKTKFRHIWEQILRLPYDVIVESTLAKQYELALADRLLDAPIVEGIDRVFTDADMPIYVCSAAPQEEVCRQLVHRHFAGHVAASFGEPVGKADALRQVIVQLGGQARDIPFFGDSSADRDAAVEVGVRFIAVIREKNDFAEVNCPKVVDFQDWDALYNAALSA
jgi:beta-phosphoglucomutase-like phosphatase (HAD superfamily)